MSSHTSSTRQFCLRRSASRSTLPKCQLHGRAIERAKVAWPHEIEQQDDNCTILGTPIGTAAFVENAIREHIDNQMRAAFPPPRGMGETHAAFCLLRLCGDSHGGPRDSRMRAVESHGTDGGF